jgi:hypothetical protein
LFLFFIWVYLIYYKSVKRKITIDLISFPITNIPHNRWKSGKIVSTWETNYAFWKLSRSQNLRRHKRTFNFTIQPLSNLTFNSVTIDVLLLFSSCLYISIFSEGRFPFKLTYTPVLKASDSYKLTFNPVGSKQHLLINSEGKQLFCLALTYQGRNRE